MKARRIGFGRLALSILLVAAMPASSSGSAPPPATLNDFGTFVISVAGRQIGMERFRILSSRDKVIAKAEIELHTQKAGKSLVVHSFANLTLDSRLRPVSYMWEQSGAQNSKLRVDFTKTNTEVQYHTVNGKNDDRDFVLPPDVVVLDDNVLSQYEILVDLYDRTSGGPQTFKAFIPQEALPGQVSVVATGRERVSLSGRSESLRHLVVTTDLARIDLWTDAHGRLERVSVPALQFNAIRQK